MRIDLQRLRGLGAILVLSGASLLAARPAAALFIEHTRFYSDDTYSTLVGEDINNPCTGEDWYWGQMASYSTVTNTHCTLPDGSLSPEPSAAAAAVCMPLPSAHDGSVSAAPRQVSAVSRLASR
jgi:hypothetical protein